jgi:NifU-like protein involved in Fe-S cluster formation
MSRFSTTLMEHFVCPRNWGTIEDADLVGVAGIPGQTRYIVLYLKVRHSRIAAARYQGQGCGPTIASGSVLTELIAGKTCAECKALSPEDVIEALGGLPADKRHCAIFAVQALENALESTAKPQSRSRS